MHPPYFDRGDLVEVADAGRRRDVVDVDLLLVVRRRLAAAIPLRESSSESRVQRGTC